MRKESREPLMLMEVNESFTEYYTTVVCKFHWGSSLSWCNLNDILRWSQHCVQWLMWKICMQRDESEWILNYGSWRLTTPKVLLLFDAATPSQSRLRATCILTTVSVRLYAWRIVNRALTGMRTQRWRPSSATPLYSMDDLCERHLR